MEWPFKLVRIFGINLFTHISIITVTFNALLRNRVRFGGA